MNQKLIASLLIMLMLSLAPTISRSQQQLIKVDGWNAYVHLPKNYNENKSYPTILFMPGLGEVGTDPRLAVQHGPGAYLNDGWNGKADGVDFIIISLQPPTAYPRPVTIRQRINILKERYRIDKIYFTGLSHGGWCALYYSVDYPNEIAGVVGVESQVPQLSDGDYSDNAFRETYKIPTMAGVRYLLFEQKNDYRRNDQVINAVNYWKPGHGLYQYTAFGGGGHCCWNEFYGGQGKVPGKFNLGGIDQTLYEWIARDVLRVLPVFITNIFVRNNTITWEAENLQPGDIFLIEESADGINFTTLASVPAQNYNSYEKT